MREPRNLNFVEFQKLVFFVVVGRWNSRAEGGKAGVHELFFANRGQIYHAPVWRGGMVGTGSCLAVGRTSGVRMVSSDEGADR